MSDPADQLAIAAASWGALGLLISSFTPDGTGWFVAVWCLVGLAATAVVIQRK